VVYSKLTHLVAFLSTYASIIVVHVYGLLQKLIKRIDHNYVCYICNQIVVDKLCLYYFWLLVLGI